jgi:UDP-N-acetylmuramate dehydrogenase
VDERLLDGGETSWTHAIEAALGPGRLVRDAPLAGLTTFRVGGPADWLLEVHGSHELVAALSAARQAGTPVTLLGGGSNVLVSDRGVRGLVVRVRGGGVEQSGEDRVRADAGVTINGLVRWTITRGLAGVEAWAGTPGTVGGAIYGNAHFQGRLIGELVMRALVVDREGHLHQLTREALEFAYDWSRLRRTREVLVWAEFAVSRGDPAALREVARQSLAYRKRTQPLAAPSAGCIFQNPDPSREVLPPDVPASAGALIDRAGLKGRRIGGARVSPTHANFVVNEGRATARDIRALVGLCQREVASRFGVRLREEIVYLGEFDESE